jgi:uncharacterized membrane-anchored protein YhcB (DUF1043 family)
MKKIITWIKVFFGFIIAGVAGYLFGRFKKSESVKKTNTKINTEADQVKDKIKNDNKNINDLINTPDTEYSERL